MASKKRKTLKTYFQTGKIPTQEQYADLIDSKLNIVDTDSQIIASDLTINGDVDINGTLEAASINTGLGAFEIGQSTLTTDNVIFSSIFASGSNGHITASGNISASGKLRGNELFINDLSLARNTIGTTFLGNQNQSTTINGTSISLGSITNSIPVTVHNSITASGNISSSGDIIANEITASGGLEINGSISCSGNIVTDNIVVTNSTKGIAFSSFESLTQDQFIRGSGNKIGIDADNYLLVTADNEVRIRAPRLGIGTQYPAYNDGNEQNDFVPEALTVTGNISGSGILNLEGAITSSGGLKIDGAQVDFTNLPTSDPNVAGRLYNDSGTVKISLG